MRKISDDTDTMIDRCIDHAERKKKKKKKRGVGWLGWGGGGGGVAEEDNSGTYSDTDRLFYIQH